MTKNWNTKISKRMIFIVQINSVSKDTYRVTREDALSLASCGNISAIISQGKGPSPKERAPVNTVKLT